MKLDELPNAAGPRTTVSSRTATTASEGEEIALLARAQKALHGSPREALRLCDEHASTFRAGSFGEEREAVAIEALVSLGRNTDARTRFDAFRARHPASSHRVHLESLFSGDSPTPR